MAVERVNEARLPLDEAVFRVVGYWDPVESREHVALVLGELRDASDVLVRVHSECLTGDVFGSRRCDCGTQLTLALGLIAAEGRGALVYLRGHEGRGIGLLAKIHAYGLQDGGLDTVDANLALGQPSDGRDYRAGAEILRDLGIRGARVLTNNPAKLAGLAEHGVTVRERIPLLTDATAENVCYLDAKRTRLGHLLDDVAG
jgi:3,4-dihydroxy 2-butanone 4-phosphate synthase/GTP cyclohydrolase II